ncbi:MAG: MBL fold metallo-hydrolase, partial [Planctomycetota bacterium]
MKIVLLGTTGYHPTDSRETPCMMLPECGVLLDAGTAMYRVPEYLTTSTLDIFLTHTHLDHVVGLTFLFDILYETSIERVRVHGEPRKLSGLQQHLFSKALFPTVPPIDWCPLTASPLTLANELVVTYFPLQHPGGSLGYRLDWPDRSLAYITDTTARPGADYIERIRG